MENAKKAVELIKSKYPNLTELRYVNIDFTYGEPAGNPGNSKDIVEFTNAYFHDFTTALTYSTSTYTGNEHIKYVNEFPEYSWDREGIGGNTNKTMLLDTPVLTNAKSDETKSVSGIWICEDDKYTLVALIDTLNSDLSKEIFELVKTNFENFVDDYCYDSIVHVGIDPQCINQ